MPSSISIWDLGAPVWSSDSSEFAARVNAGGGYGYGLTTGTGTGGNGGIFVANLDDGSFTQVADVENVGVGESYHISTWNGSSWVERGVLHYDRFSREQQVDLSKYLPDPDGEYKVRIHQVGMESAQIDSVALLENSNRFAPTSAHQLATSGVTGLVQTLIGSRPSDGEVLADIRYPDNEVVDSHEKTFEIKWNKLPKGLDFHLALTAREEDPSKFKALPFTYAGADGSGYAYTLDHGAAMKVDGRQTADDHLGAPLFSQFSRPDTGHPPATVYGYVSNDATYLYGALDFTVDNTRDDKLDWASIRVQTPQGLKTFKVDASDTIHGIGGFTKTGKVSYTHKYYEFKIPLSQLGIAPGDQVQISFQGYGSAGTIASSTPVLLPSYGDLLWAPGSRTLMYMANYAGNWSIDLDNGNKLTPIFDNWPSDITYPRFSPTGRKLMFDSGRAAQDPTSICYQKGYTDQWTFESLLNLVADLRAVQSSQSGGIILRGTASDLNFDSYTLDYAPVSTPDAWQPVAPASDHEVIDDVFTTWIPPGPGSYFVRLTVRDQAGNQRQVVKRVSWGNTPSITDLYRKPPIISPNGDGVQDVATIHYRVLAPVHLAFQFYDSTGALVRTISRDETLIGAEETLTWDGRDDNGLPLPDGTYHMKVQNYDFSIKIDAHSPELTLALTDAYQYSEDKDKNKLVIIAPALSWSVNDPNYKTSALEFGAGASPTDWSPVQYFDPTHEGSGAEHRRGLGVEEFTGHSFRLSARDEAGNQNSSTVAPGAQQLIVDGFGTVAINPSYVAAIKEYGGAIASKSGIPAYEGVSAIRWAPMGQDTGLTPIGDAVDLGDARFNVAETVVSNITQLYVQYRDSDTANWQQEPLTDYLHPYDLDVSPVPPDGSLSVKWHMAGLKANTVYSIRLHAVTADGGEYNSNAFAFKVGGYKFKGLYHGLVSPPLEEGEYALWGQEFLSAPIGEARLYVFSPAGNGDQTDDRYLTPQLVATVEGPDGTIIFRTKGLQPCKKYIGYMELYGPAGPDGTRPLIGRSNSEPIDIPCLAVEVHQKVKMAPHCGDPSPNQITIHMKPISTDGTALKLLTLSTVDASNNESVVFNVNKPASNNDYSFNIDTSNLPEGTLDYRVHLINENDAQATVPVPVIIDHTPATASISYPVEAQRVCGIPTTLPDGTTRNMMTFEGVMDDANGYHYTMDMREEGAPPSSAVTFHDSRSLNSLAGGQGINPPHPDFHIHKKTDGPIGAIFDKTGNYAARLHVFDHSGSQVCVASPNGDGVLDDVTITHDVSEPVILDVAVYPATRDAATGKLVPGATAIRQVISGSQLLPGTAVTTWDGFDDAGQPVPDGLYALVSTYTDGCGNSVKQMRAVTGDDTPPQLGVSSPQTGDTLPLMVEVDGSVTDAHLQGYAVEYGVGTAPDTWLRINSGTSVPSDGVLASWNTYGLLGDYVLRLSATDSAGNRSELKVPLTLTAKGDLMNGLEAVPVLFSPNGDGKVDATAVRVGIAADANLTVSILRADDSVARTLTSAQAVSAGTVTLSWKGKDDTGAALPDGDYTVRATAAAAGNPLLTQEESIKVALDNTAPSVEITRPTGGFVPATGGIMGSIADEHLTQYKLELTDAPNAPAWTTIASGTANQVNATFASLGGRPEGNYLLRVTADDGAQNESVQTIPFTIDNTPPVVKLAAPADGAVLSAAQAPIKVQGTVTDPNLASYALNIGAGDSPTTWTELITAAKVPADGVLDTLDVSKLADGVYTLQLVGKDKAGNSATTSIRIAVDNTAPVAAITAPAEGDFVKKALDITGSATDAHLKEYHLYVAPGEKATASQWSEIGSGTQGVDKGTLLSWAALPPDGVATLRLVVKDAAGNTSETKVQVTVDTHPPGAPTGLAGKVENGQDVHLTWNANPEPDVVGYNVYRDGKLMTATPVATPAYVDSSVADGTYQYTVTAIDHAQWESKPSDPAQIVVDTTPPAVHLYVPADQATVNGLLNVTGTAYSATDFKEYRLYAGAGATPTDWQLLRQSPVPIQNDILSDWNTVVLPEGATYTLKLEAEDIHGNVGTALATVTIDNQPPAAPTGLVAVPNGADVHLTWNANSEPDLLGYLVYRNDRLANVTGVAVGNLAPYAVLTTNYADLALPDGPYTYTIVAMDKAGNTSAASLPAQVLIDTHPPHATITVPDDGTRFENPLYVLATSADTDIAQVQFQYRAAGATAWTDLNAADTATPYELTFDPKSLGLPYGDYQLQAVATDTGNKVDPSPTPITVTYIDLTPPAATVGLAAAVNGGNVTLTWTANTETDLAGYYIERTGGGGTTQRITSVPVQGTTYIDTNRPDGPYRYTVVAVDASGNEAKSSNQATAVIYTPTLVQPFTPTDATSVNIQGQGIGAASVSGQVVTSAGTTTLPSVDADASGKFILSGVPLQPGDNAFTVRLTDADGNVSKPASMSVTQGAAPSQPTGLTATASGYDVSLSWNPNPETDIVGYRVFRDGQSLLPDAPATGLTATASSYYSYYYYYYFPPANVLNGNTNNYWAPDVTTANPVDGQWLSVKLQNAQIIKQVILQWYSSYRADDFDVQAWDGTDWITVAQVRNNTQQAETIDLARPYRTDQIRILLHKANVYEYSYLPIRLSTLQLTVEPVNAATSFADVAPDGNHSYTVTAVNGYGFESVPSAPAMLPVGDVTPPDPVTLTGQASGSDALLSWTPSASSDVARYDIYRDGKLIGSRSDLSNLSYTDSALPNGTYTYTVKPVDGAGNVGTASNEAPVTIAVTVLPAPINLTVTAVPAGRALDLAWQPGSGAVPTGYRVLRSTTAGGPYTQIGQTTQTTLHDTGLTNGTTYYYVVEALDAIGNVSANSNEASGTAADTVAPPVSLTYPALPGGSYLATDAYQDIAGSSEPDATITLYHDGTPVGTTSASHGASLQQVALLSLPSGASVPLSPDGRYGAYSANQALYVHDFSDDSEMQLAALSAYSSGSISWSADGRILVFADSDTTSYNTYLREYHLADGSITQLTNPADGSIYMGRLSPDGKRLVAAGYHNGQGAIWLVTLATDTWTALSSDNYYYFNTQSFRWSPDSTKLAYLRTSPSLSVRYVDAKTGTVTVVEPQASYYSYPSWSPDSKRLTYTVSPSSGTEVRVYDLSSAAATSVDTVAGQICSPVFSPDGRSLAYCKDQTSLTIRNLGNADTAKTVAGTSLQGRFLQWVRGGYLGIWDNAKFERIAPAGRFEFKNMSLNLGDNAFTAQATDASGNESAVSAPIIVTYSVADRPDLVVGDNDVTILPAAPLLGQSTRASVTVHNAGAVASPPAALSLVAVDPQGNSTTLVQGQALNSIAAGGSQTVSADWTIAGAAGDYTLIAIVDPLDALAEVSESNNLGVHNFHVGDNAAPSLAVSVDKAAYAANDDLSGTVVVSNNGDTFNGQLVISIEDAQGYLVKKIGTDDVNDLGYGAQATFNASWNTGSTFAGSYQMHARLYDANGQLVSDANAPFSLAASSDLTGAVSTDQAEYPANTAVHVSGTVHYTGGNTLIDAASARLRILDTNGTVQAEGS
ncbi:MAG: FlgD immunoglobulin-like domain containing protein, partial [Gammaproteobacteria bacterium]